MGNRPTLRRKVAELQRRMIEAERALERTEQDYRVLAERIGQGAAMLAEDGLILSANLRFISTLGFACNDIAGRRIHEFVNSEDAPALSGVLAQTGSRQIALRWKANPGGTPADLLLQDLSTAKTRKIFVLMAASSDSTEITRLEKALRESEDRERARAAELEAVLEAVPALTFVARDSQCENLVGSRMSYEFLRMPPGTNLSKSAAPGEQ